MDKSDINGQCHVLDFSSARQRRVMRSTFGAEVNAALDASERTYGLQLIMAELLGYQSLVKTVTQRGSVRDLHAVFDAGALQPRVDLAIDPNVYLTVCLARTNILLQRIHDL
eukprot:4076224-Amphidinium_carterae.2